LADENIMDTRDAPCKAIIRIKENTVHLSDRSRIRE
jgi:hypothetical protein